MATEQETLDSFAYYLRDLARIQELNGVNGDAKEKFTNWLAESLAWALREFAAGRYAESMRGLLQVHNYQGRIGGFWPGPLVHDATIELQNRLERKLRGES